MGNRSVSAQTPDFSERGQRVWEQYQLDHDIGQMLGQVAAVDPESGRVWIGEDALAAVDEMKAEGTDTPVWLVRVGFAYLDVKGRR